MSITARQLYRKLYRELSFQELESAQIQLAEKVRKDKVMAQYKKQEYVPPPATTGSKRAAVCPFYDSKPLRESFLNTDDLVLGQEVLEYLRAQRIYKELFSRYNGKDFEDEERLRLTARRVGLELPEKNF